MFMTEEMVVSMGNGGEKNGRAFSKNCTWLWRHHERPDCGKELKQVKFYCVKGVAGTVPELTVTMDIASVIYETKRGKGNPKIVDYLFATDE